ncbi:hypothetical protein [Geminocystis sp. NIES-3709]|uniref:hypothetical protein n=1 Tax=Geminocystis sp. NIES-3709 TaxID=1617448 RepID=UPI0005FC840E|nr:hypothetical protein [Geminocystis sp. NIES-3709]BAQ65584.1 hypothetical protein GM3709_2349 [Geminocystis sp. NIES-3709]
MDITEIIEIIKTKYPHDEIEKTENLNFNRFLILAFNKETNLYSCFIVAKNRVFLYSTGNHKEMMHLFEVRFRNFYNKRIKLKVS